MTSKSEKFRELLAKERCLQSQLSDCETAQSRMLKKAFKNLGLKLGNFGDVIFDQSYIKVIEYTDCAVRYCRNTGVKFETCEISFEDLLDQEVQE
jgi:hypothetical protein